MSFFHVQTTVGNEIVEAHSYKERGAYTVFFKYAPIGEHAIASFATDKVVAIRYLKERPDGF